MGKVEFWICTLDRALLVRTCAIPSIVTDLITPVTFHIILNLLCAIPLQVALFATAVTDLAFRCTFTSKMALIITLIANCCRLFQGTVASKMACLSTSVAFCTTVACKMALFTTIVAASFRIYPFTLRGWTISGKVTCFSTIVTVFPIICILWTVSLHMPLLPTGIAFIILFAAVFGYVSCFSTCITTPVSKTRPSTSAVHRGRSTFLGKMSQFSTLVAFLLRSHRKTQGKWTVSVSRCCKTFHVFQIVLQSSKTFLGKRFSRRSLVGAWLAMTAG